MPKHLRAHSPRFRGFQGQDPSCWQILEKKHDPSLQTSHQHPSSQSPPCLIHFKNLFNKLCTNGYCQHTVKTEHNTNHALPITGKTLWGMTQIWNHVTSSEGCMKTLIHGSSSTYAVEYFDAWQNILLLTYFENITISDGRMFLLKKPLADTLMTNLTMQ